MSEVEIETGARDDDADDGDAAPTSVRMSEVPSSTEGSSSTAPSATTPTELEAMTAERDKLKDQLLRTAADFDNYRKRTRKDIEQAERRVREEVLRDVLPIADNLERAVEAARDASDLDAVKDGVRMVLKLFEDTATRLGIERFVSVGQRFDPSLHDAFQQKETTEQLPGTILAEYQAGYRLGDKLLRPAMVVVARKPAEPSGE